MRSEFGDHKLHRTSPEFQLDSETAKVFRDNVKSGRWEEVCVCYVYYV